jgi:Tol biopolymer transport system component
MTCRKKGAWPLFALMVAVFATSQCSRGRQAAPEGSAQTTVHARDGSPSWSPDGRKIAFYSERDGNGEIYVMNADGSGQSRLTHHPADEGYPAWSPDGRSISFDSDRDGNFEIYAMDPDGSNVRRLTRHPARDVSASWSPDGSTIAFMTDRDGQFDVYVMKADGSKPTRITKEGTNWFPMWSPDGTRIAVHVYRDVHTMNTDGSGLVRLTTDPDNGMYPSWSPDGTRLAFMSWRRGRTGVFTMNADGSDQTPIISFDVGDAIDPRWSPDGSQIVFCHLPGGMDSPDRFIYLASADGTGLKKLTGS